MANLFLKVNLETIDFESETFDTQVKNIKKYVLSSDTLDANLLDRLHTKIIRTKGDWLRYDIDFFNGNYYVCMNLIFHSPNQTKEQYKIVEKIITECEKFFTENSFKCVNEKYNNSEKLAEIVDNDGFIISIADEDGGGILDNKHIEKILRENDIDFETLRINQSRFDGGASGVTGRFIYFILSSVQSGVTYDIIKSLIISKLGIPIDYFKLSIFDNFKFKRLRKIIADRIREDVYDIVLSELYKGEEEITIVFKTQDQRITLICDKDYEIKEIRVDENIS